MILTLDLSDDVIRRLTAEAERRGTHLAEVVTDLAARLPTSETPPRRRLAFVGSGPLRTGAGHRLHDFDGEPQAAVLNIDPGAVAGARTGQSGAFGPEAEH